MELTKYEQKLLDDSQGKGNWLTGTVLHNPWYPAVILIVVAVLFFYRSNYTLIMTLLGSYFVYTIRAFLNIKRLINKLSSADFRRHCEPRRGEAISVPVDCFVGLAASSQ